ncbi:MAG TPA: hypothetical protein VGC81_16700, partial [Candidatus Methylomirabilis sp.]
IAIALLAFSTGVYIAGSRGQSPAGHGLAVGLAAGIPGLCIGMTVALLPVANMTSLWCYSIVAPLGLIAIAVMIGQHEVGRRALPTAGIQVAWVAVMFLTWSRLQAVPRANTKEIAESIRAQLDVTDRVVVVPGYLVPSFQRYFGSWGRMYSLPDDGLATYIPYDHRLTRDLDPRAWDRLMAVFDSSRAGCDRVWLVVEFGVPLHMEDVVSRLLVESTSRLGPPQLLESPPPRPGVMEHSSVRRHDPCAGLRSPGSREGMIDGGIVQP